MSAVVPVRASHFAPRAHILPREEVHHVTDLVAVPGGPIGDR
jgi:hypothetical protein